MSKDFKFPIVQPHAVAVIDPMITITAPGDVWNLKSAKLSKCLSHRNLA